MSTAVSHPLDCRALLQCLEECVQLVDSARDEAAGGNAATTSMTARLRIAGQELSVPLASIHALIRDPHIVALPGTPDWIPGALRVGQQMLAVLAGEWVSELPRAPQRRGVGLAVILDLGPYRVAVLADAVHGLDRPAGAAGETGTAVPELDLEGLRARIDKQCGERGRDVWHGHGPAAGREERARRESET
jgi:hypothetical protein